MVWQGGSGPATVAASVGSTGKIGWRRQGVAREGLWWIKAFFPNRPRSLIFYGFPVLVSEYIFGCPCFREAKILKEPVTEKP